MEKQDNNFVKIQGEFRSYARFSHVFRDKTYYITEMAVSRLSEYMDVIPVMADKTLFDTIKDYMGRMIEVKGQLRAYKTHSRDRRWIMTVNADEIKHISFVSSYNNNSFFAKGFVCGKPVYRKTPQGREIAELVIAVERLSGKNDYIPCIVWGRNAIFAAGFSTGECIRIWGRVQSREQAVRGERAGKEVVYEVSVYRIEKCGEI